VLSLLAAFCFSAQALAQPSGKTAVIGYLAPVVAHPGPNARLEGFRKGMRELGYTEGKDYRLDIRQVGDRTGLSSIASALVDAKVDVILAAGTVAARTAQQATKTIPIVMANASNPVENGLVTSLARPGGNITGTANFGGELSVKQFGLLKTLVPKLSRVAFLYNPAQPQDRFGSVIEAARKARVQAIVLEARSLPEIEQAFARMRSQRVDGLLVLPDAFFFEHRAQIVTWANEGRIPTMYNSSQTVEAGGLVSYGLGLGEYFRSSARYVVRILKGAKPADLAVEQPANLELVINRKTAKAIGLTIPNEVLLRADRVID